MMERIRRVGGRFAPRSGKMDCAGQPSYERESALRRSVSGDQLSEGFAAGSRSIQQGARRQKGVRSSDESERIGRAGLVIINNLFIIS